MTVRTQTGSLAAPGAADPAPWLPQAPVLGFMVLWSYGFMVPAATRSTRSSLRAPRPRREDAARRPAMLIPRHGCHWRRREAQQGAAFGRPGARTRSEQPSSAPAEKVRRELPSGAPAGPPSRAHYGSFQFHFGRERRPAPMPVSAAPPKPRQDVNGPGGPGRPCRDATPRTVPDEARASGEGHAWLGKYRLRTLNPRPRTLNHRKSLADSGPAPGQA